jgi:CHASE3 domain sensor protein
MNSTKEKVSEAKENLRPYVERALQDEELRRNVKDAYASARSLYEQLLTKKDVGQAATKLVSDEDVQAQLRDVVAQLRSAAGRVQAAPKDAKKAGRSARNTVLVAVGVVVGLLVNPLTGPSLRGWLKRKVLGGGKDFVYHDGNGTPLS